MGYKAIFYDMDGVLLDTAEGIIESIKQVVANNGEDPLPETVLRSFIGPPVQDSFGRVYNLSTEDAWEWGNDFRTIYMTDNLLKASLYEGIIEVVKRLCNAGVIQVVTTNRRQDYAQRLFEHFDIHCYVDKLFGSDIEGKLAKADIVGLAADFVSVPKDSILMVGDTQCDALGAEKQGIPFLGVTYGYGFNTADDVNKYKNVGVATTPLEILDYFNC